MDGYAIAHVEDVPEQEDGRCAMRPVRHHLGITAFGLTGETAAAIEHLGRAIELSERFREYARHDSDFDAVRDEAGFKALVG